MRHDEVPQRSAGSFLQPTVFYRWQKEFFENGAVAFRRQTRSGKASEQQQMAARERKLQRRNEVLAELINEIAYSPLFSPMWRVYGLLRSSGGYQCGLHAIQPKWLIKSNLTQSAPGSPWIGKVQCNGVRAKHSGPILERVVGSRDRGACSADLALFQRPRRWGANEATNNYQTNPI